MVLTELEARRIAEDARRINIAGRQRMLSQRITYLAHTLTAPDAGRGSLAIRDDLVAAVTLFETAHDALIQGAPEDGSTPLRAPIETEFGTLDSEVRAFVEVARAVLANPQDVPALERLREIEAAGLLGRLDTFVTAVEQTSLSRIAWMRTVERATLVIALLIIVIEILLVFVPGHRLLQRAFGKLDTQNKQLATALASSEAMRREQADFTYSVSHDLKSPANTIQLALNELRHTQGSDLDEDAMEMLDVASDAVARIGIQIEDVLQYAFATRSDADFGTVHLAHAAQEALRNLSGLIKDSGAAIDVTVGGTIIGSHRQITMLFQNLLENALIYVPPSDTPKIEMASTFDDRTNQVEIIVTDTGIGIAPEDQARIFKLFERLHLRDAYPGTGMGLATVTRIVQNHEGQIDVSSTLGGGSTFKATLRSQPSHDPKKDTLL